MAAALTKTSRLKAHSFYTSNYLLSKRGLKFSTPDPVTSTRDHQHKRVTVFARSIFRKAKATDFSTPISISSKFSSRASSSSEKSGLVGWYLGMLRTRPVPTKCITSALIYAAADISSQTIVSENLEEGYDLKRTLRMAGYGLVILGPSVHYWYNFMSRVFPKTDLLSTLKKMALGQTTYGPAMTAVFLSTNAALQGESGSEIVARLKRDLLPTIINGLMYWPFCDFVTFKFIPVHLQPLVTNSFSYLWTIYMTYVASLAKVGTS
ncbi:Peroxisomal membrane 22 kDa (Mpv17/PMP22) family protein [Striga hermonthica]|uniref:Peroxisomal membrane 22 kDa (Mpv17/PMP22) family protein n=1 Tax=Striga hermonthica TaxID=68872 RepID=A0A9N7R1R5_STRHE|nr:Peroxisomal membrane 22 kDa (Mpv17/PMP22) family protein [Striga hermonthica]